MWQISGPPAIFMTGNVVAYLFHKYLGPHIAVCQLAQNGPILKFSKIFLHKIQIQRGSILWKNCQLMFLRPHFGGCFEKWGVCKSAQNGLIWKFFNIFLQKIRIKRGSVLWKNCYLVYLGPYNAGRFWTNGDVGKLTQNGPILTFKNIFLYKFKIQRGYLLWKNCHLM